MKRKHQDLFRELLGKAEQGDSEAQMKVADLYRTGQGVAKDSTEAVRWWREAASKGSAPAQYNLACSYRIGEGIVMDASEAAKWYRKAFDQGLGRAGANLGLMYANGEGVPQDDVEAYKWLSLAAKAGCSSMALDRRRVLVTRMTAEQIAEAKRSLRAESLHQGSRTRQERNECPKSHENASGATGQHINDMKATDDAN